MKIYLLMMLIGTLLTAIHFTSVPEQRSKTLRNKDPTADSKELARRLRPRQRQHSLPGQNLLHLFIGHANSSLSISAGINVEPAPCRP